MCTYAFCLVCSCGVNHFTRMVYRGDEEVPVRQAPPKCKGNTLTFLNFIVFVVAGLLVGFFGEWGAWLVDHWLIDGWECIRRCWLVV